MLAPIVAESPGAEDASREAVAAAQRHSASRALVVAFLTLLCVGNLDLVFHLDPNPSPLREVVAFPRPSLRAPLHWLGEVRWYLQSSMGFRPTLVRARGLLAWRWLHGSPSPTTVVRAEPWLFMRSERVLEDYRRADPFTSGELARWGEALESRRAWLERQGVRYLVVVAPNKETVYAEAMPAWATRAPGPSRLQQLTDYLRTHSKVELIDLTSVLESKKGEGRLFNFTDTHWNDLGAYFGYRAVAERLAGWFPALRPAERGDFSVDERSVPGGDLARMCGLKLDLPEPQIELLPGPQLGRAQDEAGAPIAIERMDVRGKQRFVTEAPAGEIPAALVLRDSFGEGLIPFLSRHIRSATWIWTYGFPREAVEALHPAVVIQELVERKLMTIDPDNGDALALDR